MVNELGSTVSVVEAKSFKVIQNINTLPEGFEGENYCADIHINSDGGFLYCSNRGHNSITTFRVKNDGLVERVANTPVNGDWPRNFTFGPNGKFMLVANQNSNNITVYLIDPISGIPKFTGHEISIPSPVCLEF